MKFQYHSNNGVDAAVDKVFGDYVGHACDVGANDGLFFSNTMFFEQKGWTVLCVEPNPLLAEAGRKNRRLWREVACSAEDAELATFKSVKGNNHASSSALMPEGHADGADLFQVRVRRLDRVLDEAGFPKLDYLTVDVENWERQVMAGFTVERWKPKVIVLEEWTEEVIQIPGYDMTSRHEYDNVYVRREP